MSWSAASSRVRLLTSLSLQNVLHFGALRTRVALVPATLTVVVTSMFLTRRLLARFGHRPLLLAGVASIGIGQLWLHSVSGNGNSARIVGSLEWPPVRA